MNIRNLLLGIVFVSIGALSALCLILIGMYPSGADQVSFWFLPSVWPYSALILLVAPLCTILGSRLMLLAARSPSRN
jgi:hypothetical protein